MYYDGYTMEQCKQACRTTANCTGIAFKESGVKNCHIYTNAATPYSPSSMQEFSCFQYKRETVFGTFDAATNTYSVTISWGTSDPNGQPTI